MRPGAGRTLTSISEEGLRHFLKKKKKRIIINVAVSESRPREDRSNCSTVLGFGNPTSTPVPHDAAHSGPRVELPATTWVLLTTSPPTSKPHHPSSKCGALARPFGERKRAILLRCAGRGPSAFHSQTPTSWYLPLPLALGVINRLWLSLLSVILLSVAREDTRTLASGRYTSILSPSPSASSHVWSSVKCEIRRVAPQVESEVIQVIHNSHALARPPPPPVVHHSPMTSTLPS